MAETSRIDVYLICNAKYHDTNFARLELLNIHTKKPTPSPKKSAALLAVITEHGIFSIRNDKSTTAIMRKTLMQSMVTLFSCKVSETYGFSKRDCVTFSDVIFTGVSCAILNGKMQS